MPEHFQGEFAANLYVDQNGVAEAYVINLREGGTAAKAVFSNVKKSSSTLVGNGLVAKINNLEPARFVNDQVYFNLDLTVSIPDAPKVGAPVNTRIQLECAANNGVLEGLE